MSSELVQRSKQWFEARKGLPTASKFSILMAPRGLGKMAETYARQLVADYIQDVFEDDFISADMQHGIDTEPMAADAYEAENMVECIEVGFETKDIEPQNGYLGLVRCGASPDRLVGTNGGIEIKCPKADKHTSNLLADECPKEYYDQIQGCMFVTGRSEWDFVSYNPSFSEGYRMKVIKVHADKQWQKTFKERLTEFSRMVHMYKQQLNIK